MDKVVLWDFDGTLGLRRDGLHGRAWGMAMLEACEALRVGSPPFTLEDIDPLLRSGFPWQEPEKPHTHLNDPVLWWHNMMSILANIYMQLGFPEQQAGELAEAARERFVDLDTWELYGDTLPVLQELCERGWKHLIVSNHVPELSVFVEHLGLTPLLSGLVNSAEVGYEKPNPEIFTIAKEKAGPAREIWMVGDSITADVLGAEQAGIPAILVRNKDERAKIQFDDLYAVKDYLSGR